MKQTPDLAEAKRDMISGALCALFAVAFYATTYTFRLSKQARTLSAAFMPRLIAIPVFFCACVVFFQGWRNYRSLKAQGAVESSDNTAQTLFRIGQAFAVLLLGAILYKTLGFLLTMPWMLFLLFIIAEKRERRSYGLYVLLSLVVPVLVFVLFYYGFSTLLPLGLARPLLAWL